MGTTDATTTTADAKALARTLARELKDADGWVCDAAAAIGAEAWWVRRRIKELLDVFGFDVWAMAGVTRKQGRRPQHGAYVGYRADPAGRAREVRRAKKEAAQSPRNPGSGGGRGKKTQPATSTR